MYSFDTSYHFSVILFILIIFFLIIFLWIIEPRLSRKTVKNKNEHGSSKFATIEELRKKYTIENINELDIAGFPLFFEKDKFGFKKVIFDNRSPHWTIVGSTGSGKSVTLVIPECIMFAKAKNKHSIILTDPKGEIFNTTSEVFKENGYEIITIDFRNPTMSNKINIMQPIIDEWVLHCNYDKKMFVYICYFVKNNNIDLNKINKTVYKKEIQSKYKLENYLVDYIINNNDEIVVTIENHKDILYDIELFDDNPEIKKIGVEEYLSRFSNERLLEKIIEYQNESSLHYAEANRQISTLADLVFVEKETKDPFWVSSAKHLFIGITAIFLEDYKKGLIDIEKINMTSIKKFQTSSLTKENQTILQRNISNREYGNLSKDSLHSILYSSENTYKSITSIFGDKMNVFDDINVENITSKSEFELNQLGKKATVLYLIVPDENKVYFQLVTIIVGILYQSLVKFATNKENNGCLPVKVEWILDEFANCPPLEGIDGIVSVARSRGMRFQFFIQSFSQLESVYSKTTADNILDNTALCYLKTNNYQTAETVCKKLGKSTIETNSINRNTDPLKVGANQTTSLIGRELLTANEIISLEYQTIIFPTFSNPILRDTYLYTDLFKNSKNNSPVERKINLLCKNISSYYTVEQLKYNYDNELEIKSQQIFQKQFEKTSNEKNKINDSLDIMTTEIEQLYNIEKKSYRNTNTSFINIKKSLNGFEINKLLNTIDSNFILRVEMDKINNETLIELTTK